MDDQSLKTLTESQKLDIAKLIRQIAETDLPKEVRDALISAFYEWPGCDANGNELTYFVEDEYGKYRVSPWFQ